MKSTIIPLTFALLLMACQAEEQQQEPIETQQEEPIKMEKEQKKLIEELLGTYKTSLNTSDAELARSLYAKDGIFMPSEAPSAVGSEAILGSYEYVFSQIQLNIEFYIDEIVVEGDQAFATTTSKGSTLIYATGDTIPEENRELFVFEKIDDQWKIARYMFNKMSSPN